jgi:hypothetical protein
VRSKFVCHSGHTCHRFVKSDVCYSTHYGYKRIESSEHDVLHSYTRALEGHAVSIVRVGFVATEIASYFEVSINFYNSTRRHNTDDYTEHRKNLENLK